MSGKPAPETADLIKSDFVSFVSHQLRTPLCGVSWMLELAAQTPNLPSEAADYISEAQASARRLIRLVNDLLDVARLESGRLVTSPEPVVMTALVRTIAGELQPLIEAKRHRLSIAGAEPEAIVQADAYLMRQAIVNLLSNAIVYTPSGGTIEILVSACAGAVTCAIRDSGIGVPRHAQAKIFDKFYRADNAVIVDSEGTGLGLHLVRLVAERFGGRVWCESEPDAGSLFTIEFPAARS